MPIESYRDLIVWRRAMSLVGEVYALSRDFPAEERFGLSGQIRRAAVSVAGNIAEGQGRMYRAEFRRFLTIANGSLREVTCYLDVVEQLGYRQPGDLATARALCDETGRMLVSLIRRLEAPRGR